MYFFALFIAVVMTACSSKDDFAQDTTPKPIVIKASIKGMDTKTRSTGDAAALQNTAFVDGAKINVYLQDENEMQNIPGVPADPGYVIYEKSGDTWAPTAETQPTQTLLWPITAHLNTIAIYPSEDKDGNPLTVNTREFTVASDQSKDDDYRKSDFMSFWDCWDRSTGIVNIPFVHRLTKITVVVNPNGVYSESEYNDNVNYIAVNAKKTATISSSLSCEGVSGTNANITAFNKSYCTYNPNGVSCIIPPQDIPENHNFIEIDVYSGDAVYIYKAPAGGLSFQAGKEYKFTINLANKNLELGAPSISDWTPEEKTGTAE